MLHLAILRRETWDGKFLMSHTIYYYLYLHENNIIPTIMAEKKKRVKGNYRDYLDRMEMSIAAYLAGAEDGKTAFEKDLESLTPKQRTYLVEKLINYKKPKMGVVKVEMEGDVSVTLDDKLREMYESSQS